MKSITKFLFFFLLYPFVNLAQWAGIKSGTNYDVSALEPYGNKLYVGGYFTGAGGVSASYIASWNDTVWNSVGGGANLSVRALHTFAGNLIVSGGFSSVGTSIPASKIAQWNGATWSSLGAGTTNGSGIVALTSDASNLYAGGDFSIVNGVPANSIARWNGSTWSALGLGVDNAVYAVAIYGGDLYAAGAFTVAGGVSASHIARWNGTSWFPLGVGVNANVYALEVFAGELYVGGFFTTAGGSSAKQIAKWNGSVWSTVGPGTNADVNALKTIGADLYVGGNFTMIGSSYWPFIAKWNGSSWSDAGSILGSQFDLSVNALGSFNSRAYAAGRFSAFGTDTSANHIARATIPLSVNYKTTKNINIVVYPNPFSDRIDIAVHGPSNINFSYSIYNALGQVMTEENKKNISAQSIDVSSFPNGLYFLEIISDGERIIKKIIKQ